MNTLFGSLTDSSAILANERGAVTDTQRDLLHLVSGLTFWYALGSAVVIVGIVAFALTRQGASLPSNATHVPAYFWIVLGIAIGLPLAYLGSLVVRSSRITRELASGTIGSEEGRVHGFSRDDLAVNREGRIAPAQKARLRWNAIQTGLLAIVFLAVLVGGFVLASIARSAWYAVATIGWAVILALVLPTMVGYCIKWLREGNDTIATVQGTGGRGFTYPVSGRSTLKYYIINGTRFDVGSRAYDALVEGAPYSVYYTPFTKTILSIEAM